MSYLTPDNVMVSVRAPMRDKLNTIVAGSVRIMDLVLERFVPSLGALYHNYEAGVSKEQSLDKRRSTNY